MANGGRLNLLENASTTGSAIEWPGGHGIFTATASFGGGTVKLQGQDPNGSWVDVLSASLTAAGSKEFYWPRGQLRGNVATATAVYSYAIVIP